MEPEIKINASIKNKYCRCKIGKYYPVNHNKKNLILKTYRMRNEGVGLFVCKHCGRFIWSM